jgi:hypothetical protein
MFTKNEDSFFLGDVISENSVVMWHKERSQNLGKNFNDEKAAQTSKDKQIPDNRNDENVFKKMQVIVDWIQNVHQGTSGGMLFKM